MQYPTFKCPVCGNVMDEYEDTTESGGRAGYEKTIYKCIDDDIWITIEVPTDIAKS